MLAVLTMNLNDRLQLIVLVAVTGHRALTCHHSMYHSNTRIADQFTILSTNQPQLAELHSHTADVALYVPLH